MRGDSEPEDVAEDTAHAGGLPAQLTSLVGRARALEELAALLPATRLLTLVGPGGCGKSRLALALAHARREDFGDGAWWVELAAVGDPGLVGQVVAATLNVDQAPTATVDAIVRRLRDRSALLVLDSCEHLVDACADLVARLLGSCPGLSVLATSRQPLGVPGEQLWRVLGLPVAPPGNGSGEPGAVELFFDRARLAAPSFASSEATERAARRVCRSLDGMPLAIELAAAKVAILSADQIADRLEQDIRFLRSASRTVPVRQRSLEATLEWSHRMLAPAEQALLRRLAAFAGSFSLTAAEAVCAGGDVQAVDVLDVLASLVDQSLVQVDERAEERRYRLLETVRQFAAAKLDAGGEGPAVRERHARFYLDLADRAHVDAGIGPAWLDRIGLEQENLRAALVGQLSAAPEAGGRLAGLLWPYWYRRGAYSEARLWLEQALDVADRMSPEVRVEVLTGAGVLAFLQCDYPLAGERLERALRLHRELGDRGGVATVLQRLGSIAREQGRYAEAPALHEQSLAIWEELDDPSGVATSLDYLGFAAWLAGDFEVAEPLCARALATFRRSDQPHETASALINLGAIATYRGDQRSASERLEQALAISREVGFQEGIAWSLHELAIVARRGHHPARAVGLLRESLLIHQRLGDRWRIASVLEEIAGALLARLDPHTAARILGASQTLRDALGTSVPPAERPDYEHALGAVRGRLSPRSFATAWADGATLGLDRAIDATLDAIARLYGSAAEQPHDGPQPLLTERELAVLRLLSQGLTNRQIGATLFISPSTAGVHVSNILRKLGASRRAQATGLAHELGLLSEAASPRRRR